MIGTLQAGYGYIEQLATAWPRALMTMFVVSEVHPFNDGNGRIARMMMNAELSSAGLARVIVPVRWREPGEARSSWTRNNTRCLRVRPNAPASQSLS